MKLINLEMDSDVFKVNRKAMIRNSYNHIPPSISKVLKSGVFLAKFGHTLLISSSAQSFYV